MTIQKQTIPTTNYEVGRRGKSVNKILIHWIVGTLASADAQFKKVNSTSAHYGIEDAKIFQWVDEKNTAYHAGNFTVNLESIGIEHSADLNRPATEETYKTSAELIAILCKKHNIPLDRQHIIKHSEVVATRCCGTVDIDRLISMAKSIINPSQPPMTTDMRIEYFEKLRQAHWGSIAWESLTMSQVEEEARQTPLRNKRAKLVDDMARKLGYTGDTNQLTVEVMLSLINNGKPTYEQGYAKGRAEFKQAIQRKIEQTT